MKSPFAWMLLLPVLWLPQAMAVDATDWQTDEATRARYQTLNEEIRCLVCQNESIASSSAPLAFDLRAKVRELLDAGQSDQQILTYMSERYGDFVLYDPPFKPQNYLLYLLPPFVLVLGLLIVWLVLRGQKNQSTAPLSATDKAKADALLADSLNKSE